MSTGKRKYAVAAALLFFILVWSACSGESPSSAPEGMNAAASAQLKQAAGAAGDRETDSVTLVIGAYAVAKEALGSILPQFAADWEAKTGQKVVFQESYEASGTQARSIAGGLEADVALFAMEGDVDKLVRAGLLPADWKEQDAYDGMVTRSIVVMGTREGNPLGIRDWEDLTKPGVEVLYPNPKTSGGAQWDINAIYGAGLKAAAEQNLDGPRHAKELLLRIHRNVISLDKSGRASMAAFEYGVGDVIVTYENEILSRKREGIAYGMVIPKHTILIENPAVVVERYAKKHGTEDVARAFVTYLREAKAQQLFAEAGFRPVHEETAHAMERKYPIPEGLFSIGDMGGWSQVKETLYSKRGIWYEVLAGIN
ncbi:sulfate ABC transporter substrate-binding protein [Paenibacillus apiarius]|uniref:sulfate ABC transporter substrate-binding protein n=1 Tax=Paenibacillus apiarius TaxID=46240 RepID=UPI00197D59B2|nr:sulfate ABC transporter substrate-binding protein [Paenibacillus apiarius]MBN3523316.1 sulfate ABC transporter substrate-binding protein [Paenibacillus apiarius]